MFSLDHSVTSPGMSLKIIKDVVTGTPVSSSLLDQSVTFPGMSLKISLMKIIQGR